MKRKLLVTIETIDGELISSGCWLIEDEPIKKEEFGAWLHIRLAELGATQRELAKASGVSGGMISLLARGRRAPSDKTREQIARGLGILKKAKKEGG